MKFIGLFLFVIGSFNIGNAAFALEKYVPREWLVKLEKSAFNQNNFEMNFDASHFESISNVVESSEFIWMKLTESRNSQDLNSKDILKIPGVLQVQRNNYWRLSSSDFSKSSFLSDPPLKAIPALPAEPISDSKLRRAPNIAKVFADSAWHIVSGNSKVTVAVLDTGIDYNHEDLANNLWINKGEIPNNGIDDDGNGYIDDVFGYDFKNNDALPFDDLRHGSHVSGILGATGGNGIGISGVTQRVGLMTLKFLGGSEGRGTTADALRAIEYAVNNGANIISNSWEGSENDEALKEAIKNAGRHGILFVVAAGNEGKNLDTTPVYPAAFRLPNMISVGATDKNDALANFSNYGIKSVSIAAPGVSIFSTVPGNDYLYFGGTSMACPHVSGAAALLLAGWPQLNFVQLKEILIKSADKIDNLNQTIESSGRLNVLSALKRARSLFGQPQTHQP